MTRNSRGNKALTDCGLRIVDCGFGSQSHVTVWLAPCPEERRKIKIAAES